MYFFVIESDQLYTWSDENPEPHHYCIAEAPLRTLAPTASAPSDPARLSHQTLQTLRQAGLQVCRRPRSWPQIVFGAMTGAVGTLAARLAAAFVAFDERAAQDRL